MQVRMKMLAIILIASKESQGKHTNNNGYVSIRNMAKEIKQPSFSK